MNKKILIFYFSMVLTNIVYGFSETQDENIKFYNPLKINQSIDIDGIMIEKAWNAVETLSDFIQMEPRYNSKPSNQSEVKVLYDDSFLYFGIVLYDNMDNVVYKLGEYDDWENTFEEDSDYFSIEIDSYHDHLSSYIFAVNSSGVRADSRWYDGYYDDNWDAHWQSAVKIEDEKWIIEIKIPLKSLRFNNKNNMIMGINFIRYKNENNEYISWSQLPLSSEYDPINYYGHLVNLNFSIENQLSVTPNISYTQANYDDFYYQDFQYDNDQIIGLANPKEIKEVFYNENIGIDLNYLTNSNISVDFTFNPTFQNLQDDAAEVNNSAFETYYQENRPFFINDFSIFNTPINILYTRRIGKELIKYQYFENGENKFSEFFSKLNGAFKLTGKNDNNLSYGLIAAQTKAYNDDIDFDNDKAHYSVVRTKRNIINNNSYIGFLNTNFNFRESNSHIYSIDGLFNLPDSGLEFSYQAIESKFNNLDGIGISIEIDFYSDIFKTDYSEYEVISWIKYDIFDEKLNVDHMGYLYRNDLKSFNLGTTLNFIKKTKYFLETSINFQYLNNKSYSSIILDDILSFEWIAKLLNHSVMQISISSSKSSYIDRFYDDYFYYSYYQIENKKYIKQAAENNYVFSFTTDTRNRIIFSTMFNYFKNELNDDGKAYSISTRFKPSDKIDMELSYYDLSYYKTYNFLKIRMIPLGNEHDIHTHINDIEPSESRDDFQYLFTNSNNVEQVYSFKIVSFINKNISMQYFAEYFIHDNAWIGKKYYINSDNPAENYIYPIEDLNGDIILNDDDKLLYSAKYSSLLSRIIFNWKFSKKYKLSFGYIYNKEINGKVFDEFKDIIDFKSTEIDNNNKAELFFNQTFFIKCEFGLNL